MERIQNDMTALSSQGLTIELVQQGEYLELPEEKKTNKKFTYTRLDVATKIVSMYSKDLQAAYLMIEQLEEELSENQKALEEVTAAATKSAEQVRKVLAGEQQFGAAEKKLAELMANVEQLRQSHADDGALIAQLRQQIQEAQALADSVPELANDVQYVLDAVEKSLIDAGYDLNDILDALDNE